MASTKKKLNIAPELFLQKCALNEHKFIKLYTQMGGDVNVTVDNMTGLMLAAEQGHEETITALIECKADVNALFADGASALLFAAFEGRAATVQLLLEAGAKTEYTNAQDNTALVLAAQCRSVDCVNLLLNAKADVNYKGTKPNCRSPLQLAAIDGHQDMMSSLLAHGATTDPVCLFTASLQGHAQCVKQLLNAGISPDTTQDGISCLAIAAQRGHHDVVKVLLEVSARTDVTKEDIVNGNESALTPLMLAGQGVYLEIVQLLLDAKANVNAVNIPVGNSALHVMCTGEDELDITVTAAGPKRAPEAEREARKATMRNSLKITNLLLDAKADMTLQNANGYTPLVHALINNATEHVALLCKRGASVQDKMGEQSFSPTMIAAQHGNVEAMQTLLQAQADVHVVTEQGFTALTVACSKEPAHLAVLAITEGKDPFDECVRLLLEAKALPDNPTNCPDDNHPLMYACYHDRAGAVKVLLEHKAAPDACGSNGKSALFAAAALGLDDVAELLLGAGAKMELDGQSALLEAAHRGHASVVALLLKAKADVLAQDTNGLCALGAAACYGNVTIIDLLCAANANVNMADKDGVTPLMRAAHNGQQAGITRLLKAGAAKDAKSADGETAQEIAQRRGQTVTWHVEEEGKQPVSSHVVKKKKNKKKKGKKKPQRQHVTSAVVPETTSKVLPPMCSDKNKCAVCRNHVCVHEEEEDNDDNE